MKIKSIKKISWLEIFSIWKKNEAKNPAWIKHYQKKGFKTWAAWRKIYIKPLKLNKLEWQIGTLVNPLTTVPNFYGGPFKAWQKNFYKKIVRTEHCSVPTNTPKFKELAKLAEIKNNERFKELINDFPKNTTLIALKINKKIIIIEGMHRCTAIALIKNRKKPLNSKISLAIAEYPDIYLPILGN